MQGRKSVAERMTKKHFQKKTKAENRQPDERPNNHFEKKSQGEKWEAK